MKAVLALAASLSLASASLLPRQIGGIPQCALNCALTSLGSTGCQSSDFACVCRNTGFITSLLPCVQGACSADELETTVQAASALCAGVGVTISVPTGPTETGAPSSSAPSSSAAASTTEAPMTETETTSAPMTEATSAETMTSMTYMTPVPTTAGNGTQTTGTRPPAPTGTEPGAAGRNTVALGGLGAVVALVAAFL